MADQTPAKTEDTKGLTASAAAKAVRRPVVDKDGKVNLVAVKEAEVLAFRDYGTHVVVVTIDGRKLSSVDTPKGSDKAPA